MKPALIIFVDGLSFDDGLKNLECISQAANFPVTPGAGFSNNLYYELFTGMSPDEVGHYNEWKLKSQTAETDDSILARLGDLLWRSVYLNAGIRRILLGRLLGIRGVANIPFRYRPCFASSGHPNFANLGKGSLLEEGQFHFEEATDVRDAVGKRDIQVLDRVLGLPELPRRLFVSLVDIDNLAHIYGLGHDTYRTHLCRLSDRLQRLISKFRDAYGDESVIAILSDHGMAPVTASCKLFMEKHLGEVGPQTYYYFVDSVIVRVWTENPDIKKRALGFLTSLQNGVVLSEDTRKHLGISRREFGTIIYQLNEGHCFAPNFHGGRVPKAMHGYSGHYRSQKAILSLCPTDHRSKALTGPNNTREVYGVLSSLLAD